MKSMKKIMKILLITVIFLMTVGCGETKTTKNTTVEATKEEGKNVNLTISAAASLKDSMEELKTTYESENKGTTITYNFAGSGSLQKQIEEGAEVDLFISAAPKQMNGLKDKGLIAEETNVNLLGNNMVLVVPKDSKLEISEFKDLTKDTLKKIALGEPSSVPVGQYAEEVFKNLGILEQVKQKAIYAKDVKEVLTWTESSNVDAGIVYETDAKTSDKVKVIATAPVDKYTKIIYPAAVLKASKNFEEAKSFLDFLKGDKAKETFEKYGFTFMP
ncbi:molybdate ABC transporter substrate-binding protein [Clostridium cellulovorans]|uniref:Molybdenum ABC transporter, periplasmic molybdate-binding protein n=1 Tax=Clostridium cellulovorans (strain ATCC 35296 / DSM 3052 / OCM 3 / 743B) TaxID=573061 RepID=D9SWR6_CLOC7|nr:molybdate ABC transporter substrate-binding protein [Clostridium cellulovorans]ADL51277.1 molybdenum ABC transporter, periplasmic molybdate-binding protein [Clostridium cellulovorans 743B]